MPNGPFSNKKWRDDDFSIQPSWSVFSFLFVLESLLLPAVVVGVFVTASSFDFGFVTTAFVCGLSFFESKSHWSITPTYLCNHVL